MAKCYESLVEILAYSFLRQDFGIVPPKMHERFRIGLPKMHGRFGMDPHK